jgi:hypothetical protein
MCVYMKFSSLLIVLFFSGGIVFSQWTKNEDPLTLKELHLTKLQKRKIQKINYYATTEIDSLKTNNDNDEDLPTKIDNITGERIKKIRNCLTAEQQVTWRKILMNNKPRRGVTDLPNERIVK